MRTLTWRGARFGGVPRDHWARVDAALDPDRDHGQIMRNLGMHEFPWDVTQALSFALFRTYAVPGIGRLLDTTGEFTGAVQKRYDDTALLLEQPLAHGFDSVAGRAGVRRINQMHRAYDIPDHEFRYVLSTFVVIPKRWLDDYGSRPLTTSEQRAAVAYYRDLGRHMNIPDLPSDFAGFERLLDDYEAAHFPARADVEPGSRRVADATLALMLTFYPAPARRAVEVFSRALMDQPLLDALGYDAPPPAVVRASRAALRARGRVMRLMPARMTPKSAQDLPWVRSYPDGFDVDRLGTFPTPGVRGCPVPHARA